MWLEGRSTTALARVRSPGIEFHYAISYDIAVDVGHPLALGNGVFMDPIDLATGLRRQQLTSLIDIAFRPVPAAINLRQDCAAQNGTPQVIRINIILALEPAQTI